MRDFKKLRYLQKALQRSELEAFLLVDQFSSWHLTGTPMGEALVVPASQEPVLVAKPGPADAAAESGWPYEITHYDPFRQSAEKVEKDLPHALATVIDRLELRSARIGIDETSIPLVTIESLKKLEKRTLFLPQRSFLDLEMGIAILDELESIGDTARLADRIIGEALVGAKVYDREIDVAAEVARSILEKGMSGYWFPPQILSGVRTSLSIGRSSTRRIQEGEIVQADIGVINKGFTGDVARIKVIDKPQPEHRHMHRVVRAAVLKALATIREGVKGSEIDAAARSVIDSSEYRGLFNHHTGHPVGLPFGISLVPSEERQLREGMVVTVEPGVYVQGVGGVRIEEEVVVEKTGARVLTNSLAASAELD
jgi:Xaa-Pro aminopeptidase